jgi:alpha-glucosidase
MSSHDDPRAATRFGGGALGRERQLAYLALLLALPGMPFLYQGDELGLDNGVLPADRASDPIATRNEGAIGRDGSRTPMPWAPGPHLGFTTAEPWLPVGTNRTDADTAAVQEGDPTSPLERTADLLQEGDPPAARGPCSTPAAP